jgi:hypothetical protein
VLFEDEASVLADVILRRSGSPVATVIDGSRVLELTEALARSVVPIDVLSPCLTTTRRINLVLVVGVNGVFLFLLVPEVAPALRDDVSLFAKDGRHARHGSSHGHWKGTSDRNGLRAAESRGLGLEVQVGGLE